MSSEKSFKKNDLISIIIINFNGGDYILDCVKSVFKTTNCNFEVILVDNNSTDNSSNLCKEYFEEIKIFQSDRNLGMAARNIGLDNVIGNYAVFLDADTVVPPNWLTILLSSHKQHGHGLYQGKLVKKDNPKIIESGGDMANVFGTGFARGRGEKDIEQYEKFQKITFPVGACTFGLTENFKKIGYVDESNLFFLMMDDLDYGWRGWMLGIPSYYEPKCVIQHVGSPVLKWSSKKFFYMERNRWICLLTLYSRKTFFKILPMILIYDLGTSIFLISRGFPGVKIRAFFSLFRMYSKIKTRQKNLSSTRKLSDKEIIENFADIVDIPPTLMSTSFSKIFNSILQNLSKKTKKMIHNS